ncbi:MAG: oxidase, partial [Sphingomonas sp.]
VKAGAPVPLRGIAMGGDCGVTSVETSADGGASWQKAALGADEGTYSFRRWTAQAAAPASGALTAMVRCTNTKGVVQPMEANWNGGGFMRNVVETVQMQVG